MRSEGAAGTVGTMKPTQLLHEAGQSLWLDNITRALRQDAEAFAASWQDLLARIGARPEQLARTA